MNCTHCQEPLETDWTTCPVCDTPISCRCPQCGAETKPHWKRCLRCAALLPFGGDSGHLAAGAEVKTHLSIVAAGKEAADLEFIVVPPGEFHMGIDEDELERRQPIPSCLVAAHPSHDVQFTRSFEIGKFPVTLGQWVAVMGAAPPDELSDAPDCPISAVTWDEVELFLKVLNYRDYFYEYRLPTEAEWEYAAKAGTCGVYDVDDVAWHEGNAQYSVHPVGEKSPNAWGLYDMLGNVEEWCQDFFADYSEELSIDPQGSETGSERVVRGGSCSTPPELIHVAARSGRFPDSSQAGFRCVRTKRIFRLSPEVLASLEAEE